MKENLSNRTYIEGGLFAIFGLGFVSGLGKGFVLTLFGSLGGLLLIVLTIWLLRQGEF